MLKVTGATRAWRQQNDIRLLSVCAGQAGQAAMLSLQKARQPFDRRIAVETGQRAGQCDAVLQRVTRATRRLGPVSQDLPLPLTIADDVGTVENQ